MRWTSHRDHPCEGQGRRKYRLDPCLHFRWRASCPRAERIKDLRTRIVHQCFHRTTRQHVNFEGDTTRRNEHRSDRSKAANFHRLLRFCSLVGEPWQRWTHRAARGVCICGLVNRFLLFLFRMLLLLPLLPQEERWNCLILPPPPPPPVRDGSKLLYLVFSKTSLPLLDTRSGYVTIHSFVIRYREFTVKTQSWYYNLIIKMATKCRST